MAIALITMNPYALVPGGTYSDGTSQIIPYPTSGNVNFKVCNNTGASITPGAITLNWRVVR